MKRRWDQETKDNCASRWTVLKKNKKVAEKHVDELIGKASNNLPETTGRVLSPLPHQRDDSFESEVNIILNEFHPLYIV